MGQGIRFDLPCGRGRITFLSAAPDSSIVGATASALLEVDEAQDVLSLKYEKDVAPMGASTNATRVFWGTSWTSQTLLAQQMRRSQEEEKRDGIRRVFRLTADDVAAEIAAYRRHVGNYSAPGARSPHRTHAILL
jgi:hypothetical protein